MQTEKVRPYVAAAVLRGVKFTQRRYESFIALQDKIHNNLARNRTLVSIGTHDLSKCKGPFTYEAPLPESIQFIPLNQTKKMNGRELMDFYEVPPPKRHLCLCFLLMFRMTGISGSICTLFEMRPVTLSFTIPIEMFSPFLQLSMVISPRSPLIHKTFSLKLRRQTRPSWIFPSASWLQCSQFTALNPLSPNSHPDHVDN